MKKISTLNKITIKLYYYPVIIASVLFLIFIAPLLLIYGFFDPLGAQYALQSATDYLKMKTEEILSVKDKMAKDVG